MPEAARAGVDQHGQLALAQRERVSSRAVEEAVDPLELDEVVPGAHRPELPCAALARALRDRCGVRIG